MPQIPAIILPPTSTAETRDLLKLQAGATASQAAVRTWLDALSEAEVQALVDAVDLSAYLPLTGGTLTGALTCGAITASGEVSANAGITIPVPQGVTFTDSYGNPTSLQGVGFGAIRFTSQFSAWGELRTGGNSSPDYVGSPSLSIATVSSTGFIGFGFGVDAGYSGGYFTLRPSGGTARFRDAIDSTDAPITCGAITASGTISARNGITPATADLFGTYTSDTSYEKLRLGYVSADSGYLISGEAGSAGGNLHDIKIGHRNPTTGVFSAGLTVATNGQTTIIPPTSDPGIAGALWNNAGTLTISAG